MNPEDRLRLWAVISQLTGLVIIFMQRTYGVAGIWQALVLGLMLLAALVVAGRRRYLRNQRLQQRRARDDTDA